MSLNRTVLTLAAALALTATAALRAAGPTPLVTQSEKECLRVLRSSDASLKAKVDACRQLAVIGGEDAVPVLAKLLEDPKLSHMARYALEPNPSPAAGRALREALGRLKGRSLVGAAYSVGVRRDRRAVPALTRLLASDDAQVAQAAARALGNIGGPRAVKALERALDQAKPGPVRLAICEGLFRAAEQAARSRNPLEAHAIYDRLLAEPDLPHQARAAALRGAALGRGDAGLEILRRALHDKEFAMAAAACRTLQEIPGRRATETAARELSKLPEPRQILALQTLGKRRDPAAAPQVYEAALNGAPGARVAAVRALGEWAMPNSAPLLLALMDDADANVAQAAQEAFAALGTPEVHAAAIAMLRNGSPERRLRGVALIGRCRIASAMPQLLAAARDQDARVRRAAMGQLGAMAGGKQFSALLDLLLAPSSPEDLAPAEQALNAVLAREGFSARILARLRRALSRPQTGAPQKQALLRLIAASGAPEALETLQAALGESGPVRQTALRLLADWRGVEVAPKLLELAKSAPSEADRAVALRGYLRLAAQGEAPAAQRLQMCRQAAPLAKGLQERRLLLSALSHTPLPEAAAMAAERLGDPEISGEAAAAVASVAEALLKRADAQTAAKLVPSLEAAAKAKAGGAIKQRIQRFLRTARQKAGGK